MPELTISGDKGVIATIDINPENGVAVAQGGNLYLHIDGVEIGSLWFDFDRRAVLFGAYDDTVGDWCPRESIPMPTVGPDIEETLRFLDG